MAGVPSNVIAPFVGVEFDSSRAFSGPATVPIQTLIVGQKLAAGTGNANELYLVSNADEVALLAGNGSQAHIEAVKYFANNQTTTTYVILQEDAATSTAASVALTVTGTATANGELDFYINGVRYAVGVVETADPTAIAALMETEVNDNEDSPFTAAAVAGVLTLTAKGKGSTAGDIVIEYNRNSGEQFPPAVSVATGAITAGTVDPDAQDVVDNLGDAWFQFMVGPYADNTNLNVIETYYEDMFSVLNQRDGMYFFGRKDTRAALISFAADSNRNSPHVAMGACTSTPETSAEIMAAYVGKAAASIQDDAAVPLHRLTLNGITPQLPQDRWTLIERNQLIVAGVMTFTQDLGVQSEGTVTMYLKNSAGASDVAYQYQNTLYILQRLRYTFVQRILTNYPRAKLANDATSIGAGQQVMTPDVGKTEAVAWFKEEQALGMVEGLDQFKRELVVERSTSNVNRMDWLLSPDLINQFIVGSGIMQFQLQAQS